MCVRYSVPICGEKIGACVIHDWSIPFWTWTSLHPFVVFDLNYCYCCCCYHSCSLSRWSMDSDHHHRWRWSMVMRKSRHHSHHSSDCYCWCWWRNCVMTIGCCPVSWQRVSWLVIHSRLTDNDWCLALLDGVCCFVAWAFLVFAISWALMSDVFSLVVVMLCWLLGGFSLLEKKAKASSTPLLDDSWEVVTGKSMFPTTAVLEDHMAFYEMKTLELIE